MSALAHKLLQKYYANRPHPYRIFEEKAHALVNTSTVLLDAGCGRTAPVLAKFRGQAERLVGVDLVEFKDVPDDIETHNADLANIPLPSGSVDLIISRSVFEHLTEPDLVYREMARILKPGGKVLFLTANMWDYGTLIAKCIPNRWHGRIVKKTEGRDEIDTFPTAYKTNTRQAVNRLAANSGFDVSSFEYISQYPNYLLFNGVLFFIGTCFERLIHRVQQLAILRGWILVTLHKR